MLQGYTEGFLASVLWPIYYPLPRHNRKLIMGIKRAKQLRTQTDNILIRIFWSATPKRAQRREHVLFPRFKYRPED